MNHQEALVAKAVERYLLNELSSSQKEQFEEHYFSCAECANALKEHEMLLANVKAVLTEMPAARTVAQPTLADRIRAWIRIPVLVPAMVAILVVGFVGFNRFATPLAEPPVEMAYHLTPATRGDTADEDVVKVPLKGRASTIRLDVPLNPGLDPQRNPWESFTWTIQDSQKQVQVSGPGVSRSGDVIFILPPIPVGKLSPGTHRLVLHPLDGSPDETALFVVVR